MSARRIAVPALIAGSVLLAASFLAGAQEGEQQPRVRGIPSVRILPAQPPEPLVTLGPVPDLEILFSSEVRGFYQPCG